MPRKSISFELDFMIKDIFPRFTVKQFDDASFNIKPKNQGLDYDTTGMTGKIFVGVNDDMFMQTTGITVSSNNINVLLDKNMLQKNGRAYAEIELTDSAGTITSSSFIFDIDAKIGEGGQIPGEYEGFVEKYERLISEFKSQVNSTINNCNNKVNTTINNCNTNVDNKLNSVDSLVNVKISDFEKRFNRLISSQQQDAEVIDARYGPSDTEQHPTLGHRLNHMDSKFEDITSQLAHNESKINLNLLDFEIEGQTDTQNIQSAFNYLSKNGGKLNINTKEYYLNNVTSVLKNDIEIDFHNSTLNIANSNKIKLSGEIILTTTISKDCSRGSYEIELDHVDGIQKGDILNISNDTVAETAWNTKKTCTSVVARVEGNKVYLSKKINFDFLTSESNNTVVIQRPVRVVISNLILNNLSISEVTHFDFEGLVVCFKNIKIISNNVNAYGIYLNKCVNSIIENVSVDGGTYPFLVNRCRDVKFYNLYNIGDSIRHIISIANWSSDIYINGVYGAGGLVESHLAFNVHYKNVNIVTDSTWGWNFRSIGGSITDSIIDTRKDSPQTQTLVQTLNLTDTTLWEDAKFILDNVKLNAIPNDKTLVIQNGHNIYIKNCEFPDGTVLRIGPSLSNNVKNLYLQNNKGISHVYNRTKDLSIYTDSKGVNAINNEGVYEIKTLHDTVERDLNGCASWSNKGKIDYITSGDNAVIPIKIYPQNKAGDMFGFQHFFIKIRFIIGCYHGNSGIWDMQENEYHIYYSPQNNRASLGLTPAYTSSNTGITNESVSMEVSSLNHTSNADSSECLTHYVGFDLTITSGRTNPKYDVYYEIDYYGIRR